MAYMVKDYRKAVGDGAERTFKKVCEIKCKHSAVSSWDEMVRNRSISCSSSGSIALQLGGCMDVGKKMGHVLVKGTGIKPKDITSIQKAMYGVENIRHCRLIWVNCYYKDLPVWLRQRGVIYIQWSNCCTSAGRGSDGKYYVWSTNEEGGYHRQPDGSLRYDQYKETSNRSGVLSSGGHYPWGGKIYVCIVPEERWLQHWAIEVMLERHGKKETREDHFGIHAPQIQKFVDHMCRDHDYFCKWAADYIFERYGTIDDFYKKDHFDYRKEVQACINQIDKYAHETWKGMHGGEEQRKKDFGKLFEVVQRQVNRTTK